MFVDILKEALALLRKNLNLAQLVFIFFIVITLFAPTIIGVKLNIKILPVFLTWYAFLCAFFAGLFFAFKKSIDYETNPPKNENSYGLSPLYFSEFFQGVGLFVKKFLLAGILVLFLLFAFGLAYDYFVSHYVVIPEIISKVNKMDIFLNDSKMLEFINTLSYDDRLKIAKLSLLTFFVVSVYGYLTMLYPVVLVNQEKDFFNSFFVSIKCLAKNLPVSVFIFLFFNVAISLAAFISATAVNNIFVSVIAILIQCYLNVWYILSLFVYYEKIK